MGCWALKIGTALSSTTCACWCDGCTFSHGYEILCICFKAAISNLSPAAGHSMAISLMWYAPSQAALIIITIGKQKSAICWIHCLCKEVHSFKGEKLNLQSIGLCEIRKGVLVDCWQPSRLVLSSWFCSLDFWEIYLYLPNLLWSNSLCLIENFLVSHILIKSWISQTMRWLLLTNYWPVPSFSQNCQHMVEPSVHLPANKPKGKRIALTMLATFEIKRLYAGFFLKCL